MRRDGLLRFARNDDCMRIVFENAFGISDTSASYSLTEADAS
jgi:hypothetical protein